MSNQNYDAVNNVLYVGKKPEPKLVEKRELRGFIISLADNEDDMEAIQEGDHTKLKLAPVLAPNEQSAIDVITQQTKIPLSILSYEYLRFQLDLLESLSVKEDIKIISEQSFAIKQED